MLIVSTSDRCDVIDATAADFVADERIAEWCAANPPGLVWVGDWHTGTSPSTLTKGYAEVLSRAWLIRSKCWGLGVECSIGWGYRPDVLSPQGGRAERAAGLVADFAQPASITLAAAQAGWPGWAWDMDSTLDPTWWPETLSAKPKLAAYCFPKPNQRIRITGSLAAIGSPTYRDWAVAHAADVIAAVEPDWLLIGAKPWEIAGSAVLTPSNLTGTNLVQPPAAAMTEAAWAASMANLLARIAALIPVVTMTRPPDVPLSSLLPAGHAVHSLVTGEYRAGVLP